MDGGWLRTVKATEEWFQKPTWRYTTHKTSASQLIMQQFGADYLNKHPGKEPKKYLTRPTML